MRFMCDFRGLNDISKKDSYPLPHIRDVLDKMHRTEYSTRLDAASLYWSMPLAEVDKEKNILFCAARQVWIQCHPVLTV